MISVAPFGSATAAARQRRASPPLRRWSGLHQHLDRLVLSELHRERLADLLERLPVRDQRVDARDPRAQELDGLAKVLTRVRDAALEPNLALHKDGWIERDRLVVEREDDDRAAGPHDLDGGVGGGGGARALEHDVDLLVLGENGRKNTRDAVGPVERLGADSRRGLDARSGQIDADDPSGAVCTE